MLNKIVLMGRLTADPELRHTQAGIPIAGFSIACDRDYAKDGVREVDFFDVVAWRNRAEFVSQHFTKGKLICVEGRLQKRPWVDRDNQKRYQYEVVASSVYFAGYSKGDSQADDMSEFDPYAEDAA